MRRWLLGGLVALSIAGCSGVDGPVATEKPVNRQVASQMVEFLSPSITCVLNGRRRLSLGEPADRALTVFPRPSRGFPIEEVIPGLPEGFKSVGWESNTDGFGAVIYENQIVLLMRQFEALDTEQFAQLLESIQSANPSLKYEMRVDKGVDYWFATDSNSTQVISRIATKSKAYQVTVSLGESHLMTAMNLIPPAGEVSTIAK
ncbi:MAG: hypothetical protein WCK51_15305 [Armatimonadota bacterium]